MGRSSDDGGRVVAMRSSRASGARSVVGLSDEALSVAALSDEALAHAAVGGDAEALGMLFDRMVAPVTAFLSRLVGSHLVGSRSREDVEDLVQATFLAIASGNARFDGRSQAKTWVLGIAANLARRKLRTEGRRARLLRAVAWLGASTATAASGATGDVEREVEVKGELARVRAALDALPVTHRAALLLCELHGLSAKEAAVALGSSEAAIWRRVSRARDALRAARDAGEPVGEQADDG